MLHGICSESASDMTPRYWLSAYPRRHRPWPAAAGSKAQARRAQGKLRRQHQHAARDPEPPRLGEFGPRRGTTRLRGGACFGREFEGIGRAAVAARRSCDAGKLRASRHEWEGRAVFAHHKLAATERLMSASIGEPDQWKRYDSEFHQALISNCGSRALMEGARRGVRQIFSLPDDRAELPWRGASTATPDAARMRA